ncbi:hypothetical protein, unlikely [Trypanosoma brucei brucei TREU927]|uniref:Uncharacterized protein n=1 Tax=Trypanosoma brucei brucei (strain 927/4 GUTat10.1) TaxID=185431 RepID=Q38DQ6_TRYB2|nr:hypothetical protein, unlikely [Trypanosoma brucei brucei TREU927]EAN77064.1 hypothetical protein, unlikely [Trypanosoma brucei brucei TREU927]
MERALRYLLPEIMVSREVFGFSLKQIKDRIEFCGTPMTMVLRYEVSFTFLPWLHSSKKTVFNFTSISVVAEDALCIHIADPSIFFFSV